MYIIEVDHLQQLFSALEKRGYSLVGPTIRDGAIVLDGIRSVADLPKGWTDDQRPGSYALRKREDDALFGYVVGPISWKKFLFPPRVKILSASRVGKGFHVDSDSAASEDPTPKRAFVGIRSCELYALALNDKVFSTGEYADPMYKRLRENICLVAVDCLQPGGNCFCVSMKTGPRVKEDFDLALTEIVTGAGHWFAARTGSALGNELMAEVKHRDAVPAEEQEVVAATDAAADHMGRQVTIENVKEMLYESFDHQIWDDIAKRCLTCANCTMVCPTCFCSTVEDSTDLTGSRAERTRRWDSCFTMDFARVAGGNMRPSTKARYRQWFMHKFAFWEEQFGRSGCVGCGRCITWCPVGIDVTEELNALKGPNLSKA
jgi:sulfhydrogenase subunit beta (sulfur reductase)